MNPKRERCPQPTLIRLAEEPSRGNVRLVDGRKSEAKAAWPPEGWTRKGLLENLFMHCDDDKSGALSLKEFMQLFELDAAAAKKVAQIKFAQADAGAPRRASNTLESHVPWSPAIPNAENVDNKLSKDEFVAYYEKHFSTYDDAHFLDVLAVMLDKAEATVVKDVAPAVITEAPPPTADGSPTPVVLPAAP